MHIANPVLTLLSPNFPYRLIEGVVPTPPHHQTEPFHDQPIFLDGTVAHQPKTAIPLLDQLLNYILLGLEIVIHYPRGYGDALRALSRFVRQLLIELSVDVVDVGTQLQGGRITLLQQQQLH